MIYTYSSKELKMPVTSKPETRKNGEPKGRPTAGTRPPNYAGRPAGKQSARTDFAFERFYLAAPNERIDVIKQGFDAERVGDLAERMAISKDALIDTLRLSRATVNRKARNHQKLSQDETERVLGVETLIGQVETMVRESGDPEGFDAARWVSNWLRQPIPALGGEAPAAYMDTAEGQKLVASLLAMSQSGSYA
jgi:putative toxin-antitoxin system antitoxin component (TIGR02293 family)